MRLHSLGTNQLMKPLRHLAILLGLFTLLVTAPPSHTAGVPFAALQFLIGNWEIEAKPSEGTGHFEFALDLQGKVIVRKNHFEIPANGATAAVVHDDLLVITEEGVPAKIFGTYFDNLGYLGRYNVTANGSQVTLISDSSPKYPRYRLTYTALPDGRLNAKLEYAPAGKPNAFVTYTDWVAKKAAATP